MVESQDPPDDDELESISAIALGMMVVGAITFVFGAAVGAFLVWSFL